MNSESIRIADQLRRAFQGEAWHGPSLRELLAGITAEQAVARPAKSRHSIWELVLHIDVYVRIAAEATEDVPLPKLYVEKKDWFEVTDPSPSAWTRTTDALFANAERFAQAIEGFGDARLAAIAPGRDYDFYFLFHGVVQHSLYHAGQIALLKSL